MKKTTRKTASRPRRVAPTPTSTALATLKQSIDALRMPALQPQVLTLAPPAGVPEPLALRTLDDAPQLGMLGLQPLVLSEAAEAILAEPIDHARVSIKPTGAVYYSHIEYTRWFNRAFGRAQWSCVPITKPQLSDIPDRKAKLATQTFMLFVHGKPVAQATGEQEYHPDNDDQSYADVLEALNASALRRVAKRLGIGLELWDRPWTEQWRDRFAVKVWVEGKNKPQWRRKDAPPLYKERGSVSARRNDTPRQEEGEPSPAQQRRIADGAQPITDAQKRRLWAIFKKTERTEDELKQWLLKRFAIDSTSKIKRVDYDLIIESIQGSGALPLATEPPPPLIDADDIPWGAREPGEEG